MTETGSSVAVDLKGVEVTYQKTVALHNFNLQIAAGETVALLGPSGSGKSTALKAIAGFHGVSAGSIHVNGRDITNLPPAKRGIGIVVQSYALFPHMRVRDNVAFGLTTQHFPKSQISERVNESLRMVGMSDFAHRYPGELSGGQQQRIAIARALAPRPKVMLLDEPLSALDARLREGMVEELKQLRRELPDVAMLYVTHDQSEALVLADRIGIMRDGYLVDLDTAERLYNTPPTAFTATFLGGSNVLEAHVSEGSGSENDYQVMIGDHTVTGRAESQLAPGQKVLVSVRPQAITVNPDSTQPGIPARVDSVMWHGSSYRIRVVLSDGRELSVIAPLTAQPPEAGQDVSLNTGVVTVLNESAQGHA